MSAKSRIPHYIIFTSPECVYFVSMFLDAGSWCLGCSPFLNCNIKSVFIRQQKGCVLNKLTTILTVRKIQAVWSWFCPNICKNLWSEFLALTFSPYSQPRSEATWGGRSFYSGAICNVTLGYLSKAGVWVIVHQQAEVVARQLHGIVSCTVRSQHCFMCPVCRLQLRRQQWGAEEGLWKSHRDHRSRLQQQVSPVVCELHHVIIKKNFPFSEWVYITSLGMTRAAALDVNCGLLKS